MYHEIDIKNISSGISAGFPGSTSGKEPGLPTGNARDVGLIPGSERCPGEGHCNPPQYSCFENPMDRGDWWATVHKVTQSQTQQKRLRARAPVVRTPHFYCCGHGYNLWSGVLRFSKLCGAAKIKRKKKKRERERIAVPSINITYFFEKKKL